MLLNKDISQEQLDNWELEGYTGICFIENKGWCGLYPFIYTIGLIVGLDEQGYNTRYCYPRQNAVQAVIALENWKHEEVQPEEDPQDEFWIKRKGDREYQNSKYIE